MSSRTTTPRSAADATRFTSTTPQPQSKTASPRAPPGPPGETMEQRVARLRAAHLAARNAKVSWTDRMMERSRRFFDSVHRVTIVGLVGLTAVAGVFTAYAVYDMAKYNRKRRQDFIEAQLKSEADELAKARLAFLQGEATPEQVALVEQTLRQAEATGAKLPPLLSAPSKSGEKKEQLSLFQQVDDKVRAETGAVQATGGEVKSKVKSLLETEREKQRQGGMLDQLGLDAGNEGQAAASRKSWWKFW